MQEQSLNPVQIRVAIYIVRKHKWKILALFLSTVITVAIGSLMATPIYQASAQLLVKPGREDIYVSPTESSRALVDYSKGSGQKVNTEIAILKSHDVLMNLVKHFGVNRLFDYPDRTLKSRLFGKEEKRVFPPPESALRAVRGALRVSASSNSNVINITFDWPDPTIAAKVLNALINLYLDRHLKIHTNPGTYTLLQQQAKKWEVEMKESERRLEQFKRRNSITSLPQQRTMLLNKLSNAESQKKETEIEIYETMELVSALEVQLSNLDRHVQLQETVNKSSNTLTALKEKLAELELQGLKEEITRIKQMIAEEENKEQKIIVSGESPTHQDLQGELLKAKAKREALKARLKNQKVQVAAYGDQLKTLDSFANRINELERQVAMNEGKYKLYLTKFEEAKIEQDMNKMEIANVRILQPAVPNWSPVKPKKRLNVIISAFLGLFAGIGAAFLIELLHPVFRTREDVEQFLGLPVLATLPKVK